MAYTFGGPELMQRREQTISGEKDDRAVYIVLETTVRLLLRVPDRISGGTAGGDVQPSDFEVPIRQECASALVGLEANGFTVDLATVAEFQPGDA